MPKTERSTSAVKPKVSAYRRGLIAKIKIAQKDLGIDDATYRDMLWNLSGRDSCRDLTDKQLVMVIAHLRSRGWQGETGNTTARPKVSLELEPLRSKIGALLADSGKSWAYADGVLKKMYGIPGLPWANRAQMLACIAALTKQAKRTAQTAETAETVEA